MDRACRQGLTDAGEVSHHREPARRMSTATLLGTVSMLAVLAWIGAHPGAVLAKPLEPRDPSHANGFEVAEGPDAVDRTKDIGAGPGPGSPPGPGSLPGPLLAQGSGEAARSFDIPPQSLATALDAFAEQAGVAIVYRPDDLDSLRSPGISGTLSPRDALRGILRGTGVTYEFQGQDSVTLRMASSGGALMLDPISVTGEKVERPYAETYASVGVATEEDIETYNIDDLHDSFNLMANVRHFPSGQGNNGFQIRGLNADGITQPANSAPLTSVIIDGATQSTEGLKRGSRGTWDVSQVEVLRGPQSTTRGRNALAGAVIIETNDPTYEYEAAGNAVVGTLDRREGALMVSGPIVADQMAFRLSGEYRDQTTDISFSDPDNEPLAEDKYYNVRGKLLLEPEFVEGLEVLIGASHVYDQPTARPVSGPDYFDREYNETAGTTEFREMKVNNYHVDVSYALDSRFTLHGITALNMTSLDLQSAPGNTTFIRDDNRADTDITQDLRLEIGEGSDGLSGTAGLFYGNFDRKVDTFIEFGGLNVQTGTFDSRTDTLAAYADLRYELTDRLSIIAGARYQRDRVRNISDITSDFGDTVSDTQETFNVFLPKGGLAYDLTDEDTVALTVSRGYRQGFNEVKAGTGNELNIVDPEFSWTYELAYRHNSSDNRLVLGANLFFNQYQDQQVTITDEALAPLANTQNAGSSISYGMELEGRYDFGNGLNLLGAIGVLHSELRDFEDESCSSGSSGCENNQFPEAPTLTATVAGSYRHESGAFASASGVFTGSYYASGDLNNDPDLKIERRFLTNVKLGYEYEGISASLYVDNLFNEDYLTGRSTTGDEATIGDGRTIGGVVQFKF